MKTTIKSLSSRKAFSISKKEFIHLANQNNTGCISIYMTIHRKGESGGGIDINHNKLQLKNCIKSIAFQLSNEYKFNTQSIQERLRPVELLLKNNNFWKNQSDGLAIFLNQEGLLYYKLPISFETHTYIDNHFYLKHLIPLFNGEDKFYLLKLSQKKTVLYKATRHTFSTLFTKEMEPINQALIFEDKQKNIQARSLNKNKGSVLYHGHGLGKDDKNKKIELFFKQINEELMSLIGDKNAPLVIASQDYYFPIYKDVSSYSNLHESFISGNPDNEKSKSLCKKAWSILKKDFQQEQKEKVKSFQNHSTSRTISSKMDEIIPGAYDGNIETLFINASTEVYGLYDEENRTVIYDKTKKQQNISLINLAAIKSFIQGAKVYLVCPNDMPIKGTTMNAVFRY